MKIILTGLLILYALHLITKFVGPILLQYLLKKISAKIGIDNNQTNHTKDFNLSPKHKSKNRNTSKGEYIDFEEID